MYLGWGLGGVGKQKFCLCDVSQKQEDFVSLVHFPIPYIVLYVIFIYFGDGRRG